MRYRGLWDRCMHWRNGGVLLLGLMLACCVHEPESSPPQSTYVTIEVNQNIRNRTRAYAGIQPGDEPDRVIQTLRILVFERGGTIADNVRYLLTVGESEVIRHPIATGDYDFVFIANEPEEEASLLEMVGNRNELYSVAFPESAFEAQTPIPMLQSIDNVTVTNQAKAQLNEGTRDIHGNPGYYAPGDMPDILTLELDRLATRVEIVLRSQSDLTDRFTGITLSNIPDRVPLFAFGYTGGEVQRTGLRTYQPDQFAELPEGVWTRKVSRIILPSNNLGPEQADDTKAVVLTVNIADLYNPSRRLRIETDNYSLPYNSWLDVSGTVRQPLELSIAASNWDSALEDWELSGVRMLNVSSLDVTVPQAEGVRIYFWSNMANVRVLPDLYVGADGSQTIPTDQVFVDLAATGSNPNPGNFYYDPSSGQGYLDIWVNQADAPLYRLVLAAEDETGQSRLDRVIRVAIQPPPQSVE